ncbi:MAG TPA: anthranilate synthase component I [Acidimicrobiales bacterium]|nr:anthranilate synthase component I [Acidimicrobiales bacterium]
MIGVEPGDRALPGSGTVAGTVPANAKPDLERFCELAGDYSVVPIWRELVADTLTPVGAFRALVGDGPGFLLESVEHGERWSRFSFVGRSPAATLVARGRHVEVTQGSLPDCVPRDDGVLACIESLLDRFRSPSIEGLPPLHGGLVGYLGYDVVREIERLGAPPPDDLGHPDAVVSVIGELAAFDHWRQRVTLVDNVLLDADRHEGRNAAGLQSSYSGALQRLEALRRDLEHPGREPLVAPPSLGAALPDGAVRRGTSAEHYRQAVEVAKEYIRAGDAFQVVLSQRFDFELGCDPFDVYRVLRQVNPSPYMFFLRQGGVSIVGASPEPMIQLLDGRVVSRPIAGTRRRGGTDEEDRRLEAELVEHPKELAEHVMLVDLARNDVGRVAKFGSEHVDELMTVERYSHVMHLTSEVSGQLLEGRGPVDVLRATLPAGTVSGAPKVRAMEIIDELEPTKRGPYAGVVGYIDFSGNLDTAITIRTLVASADGRASVQAGAGIVADSDPAAEDEECAAKAAAVLTAVAGARQLVAERRLI